MTHNILKPSQNTFLSIFKFLFMFLYFIQGILILTFVNFTKLNKIQLKNVEKIIFEPFRVGLRCYQSFNALFKKLSKIEKILKNVTLFRKSMFNSSYTYCMKEKLMSADTKFYGEARECVRFLTR
jgi:ASC-1-like (ASCH) protein